MKKVIKVISIVIGVVLFFLFGLLAFNYIYNEIIISKYEKHDYSKNVDVLEHTNIIQPYIVYYNNGNIHYQKGEYEEAIENYKIALEQKSPHEDEECYIRINLALAIIATLNEDYDSAENIQQSIDTLTEARQHLVEEDCATEEGDGHNETAEKLKDEIDALIEQLKQQQESQNQGNQEQDDPQENQQEAEEQQAYEEEIKEELQQIQSDAQDEREDTLQLYEETDYNWNGIVW